MINLILCGGSGTRLWPVSRSLMPKQFAPLFDGQSLFRKTVKTNSAVCSSQFIVSNADQFFLAKDQLEAEGKKGCSFLLEPVGRNTAPAIALACLTLSRATKEKGEPIRIALDDMKAIPSNSIDYAVMEKSDKVKVVPSDIGWSDLGSFDSLYGEYPHDENGNNVNPRHISVGSKNSLVMGSQRTIATIDLNDMLIVDTPDALLVAPRSSSQKVKQVVERLKENGSDLISVPQTVNRPWGTYSVLESSESYKMKRIVVKPGKRLSLQKHLHRSEHWVVVSGTATCTVGDKVFLVRPNESTYIPAGMVHRLQNEGKLPLVIVEVQVGEYTGEDDIIRVEDDFNRCV